MADDIEINPAERKSLKKTIFRRLVWGILLIGVLLVGAYFRFIGMDWDQSQHLHPDERFMTMVTADIKSVQSLGDFFNTTTSSLNPNNRGYGFFVYGTLPLFIVRYVSEWLGKTGYDQNYLVGRYISAIFDLGTVLIIFLTAVRLFKKVHLGLLAACFYALAVLPIQLSHYYTVDTFLGFFSALTIYFGICVLTAEKPPSVNQKSIDEQNPDLSPVTDLPAEGVLPAVEAQNSDIQQETNTTQPLQSTSKELMYIWTWIGKSWVTLIPYAFFGIAVGMAMASKVTAIALVLLLPAAAAINFVRLSPEERKGQEVIVIRNLVIAGILAIIVFRICQPYAFSGPGFFGLKPNPKWVDSMGQLSAQSGGDNDFPPALQWARRPITFAWDNMVKWGLGLPLGLVAWVGFFWIAWRMIKGEWKTHVLLWGWTVAYFTWQEVSFTRSMRYQMPVYSTLAIMAAWAVFALWDLKIIRWDWINKIKLNCILAVVIGVGVLGGTGAWAYAFTQIYQRPVTRVEASEWIYQNVPASINLQMDTANGPYNYPMGFRLGFTISPLNPWVVAFTPQNTGLLSEIDFSHVVDKQQSQGQKTLLATISDESEFKNPLAMGQVTGDFPGDADGRGKDYKITLTAPMLVQMGKTYYLRLDVIPENDQLSLAGPTTIGIVVGDEVIQQSLPDPVEGIRPDDPFKTIFSAQHSGTLRSIYIPRAVDWEANPAQKTLRLTVTDGSNSSTAEIQSDFAAEGDARGRDYTFVLDKPFQITADQSYTLTIEMVQGSGTIGVYGSKKADESTWDDPLPIVLDGFSPYDYNQGSYRSDLNFEMYWDDNTSKLERFETTLDQTDYIFISSNRQWGTTTRVQERYPLTTAYYRNLLGCPAEKDIIWCYSVATPGMFNGKLGFDLVKTFQSDPNLGSLRFNTQFAEEAFTVYDHPKVLIFKKRADYNTTTVRSILGAVDLTHVIHATPGKVKSYPATLMLPDYMAAIQQAGGTWAELFNRASILNSIPVVGLVVWYLAITLLGWCVYPMLRLALGGLTDKGYPFARLVGMLILAYLTWLVGSYGIPFMPTTIWVLAALLVLFNAALFYIKRDVIIKEIKQRWKYILAVEVLTLSFFVLFLLVRLGNPDLWHPAKGGEKPMDFSYFNAVLKSTIFPPYDPWMAGGILNYYYYGFVLVGVPVKALGIVPSIAYNLILPTLFSLLAMGAFSIGWNLLGGRFPPETESDDRTTHSWLGIDRLPLFAGLSSAVGMVLLGNLGTVRMIWYGFQKLVVAGDILDKGNIVQHWLWAFQGLGKWLGGASLINVYYAGDWYWIPSRAIPGEPITEFPLFTFLYADPHAHMIAFGVTVLVVAWALSIIKGRWQWKNEQGHWDWSHIIASLLLGALAIGTLRPTNTWDMPVYLGIGLIAVVYTSMRYWDLPASLLPRLPLWIKKWAAAGICAIVLAGLSFVLFQPYSQWYGPGYNAIELWKGDHTPFWSYITHWGLFLFIITSWMVWETIDWMAKTPLTALNKLVPYKGWLQGGGVALVTVIVGLYILGVHIIWLALPLALWAGILLCRPGQSEEKRLVLLMIGTALLLTMAVELIVLKGDIGRMNTVFKFYLQAWVLFALSAGAALLWLAPAVAAIWSVKWRIGWRVALALLVGGAALFPLTAGTDKITDRMSKAASHTLDGMTYMAYSQYSDSGKDMNLIHDYQAILWMQQNVAGSPVIVEGNVSEYRWGSRFTIYTGLPGVVGWNWHQRQQRALTNPDWVTNRIDDIRNFYMTTDRSAALAFLQKYNVKYIIVGELEEAIYPGTGLNKFEQLNGDLWDRVYQESDTAIYKVIQ